MRSTGAPERGHDPDRTVAGPALTWDLAGGTHPDQHRHVSVGLCVSRRGWVRRTPQVSRMCHGDSAHSRSRRFRRRRIHSSTSWRSQMRQRSDSTFRGCGKSRWCFRYVLTELWAVTGVTASSSPTRDPGGAVGPPPGGFRPFGGTVRVVTRQRAGPRCRQHRLPATACATAR
jgi:hypothetical protein